MLENRLALGIISGLAGNLVKNTFDRLMGALKREDIKFKHMAAGLFFKREQVKCGKGNTLGLLVDYGQAALTGIPLVYALTYTGRDRYPTKGLLFGALSWGLGLSLVKNLGRGRIYPHDPVTKLVMALSQTAGGAAAAWTAVKLLDKRLYEQEPLCRDEKPLEEEQIQLDRQRWARTRRQGRTRRKVSTY